MSYQVKEADGQWHDVTVPHTWLPTGELQVDWPGETLPVESCIYEAHEVRQKPGTMMRLA